VADALLSWIQGLPTPLVYAVLMALSAVENVVPPVPADVAVVLGAFLSQRGVTSAPLLGTLCWLANTASAAGMFYYARAKGRAFFETGWPRRLVPPAAIRSLEKAYARHGVLGIFLSRFLPGVRAAVTPFAGLVGMPPLRALLPAAVASAIWYAVLVAIGTAVGMNWERARAVVERMQSVLGLVSLAITAAIAWWLWRRHREHSQES
jgi:membrane protein DedA with SNARE-associated domain